MFWVRSEASLRKPYHILRHVMAGHFYFTKLLLPLLTATAKNAPANSVRVINVSSLGHYLGAPEGIRWDTLVRGQESLEARRKLGSARLFGQSKTVGIMSTPPIDHSLIFQKGNILLSNEIARRYGSEGIVSISLHPGTNLSRHAGSLLHQLVQLLKFAGYYVISCGDLSFMTDESKALTDLNSFKSNVEGRAENAVDNLKSGVEDRAENAVSDLETGDLPDMGGIDIAGSHGAITSLYAGTTADAGNLNGKVRCLHPTLRRECTLTFIPVSHRLGTRHASTPEGS